MPPSRPTRPQRHQRPMPRRLKSPKRLNKRLPQVKRRLVRLPSQQLNKQQRHQHQLKKLLPIHRRPKSPMLRSQPKQVLKNQRPKKHQPLQRLLLTPSRPNQKAQRSISKKLRPTTPSLKRNRQHQKLPRRRLLKNRPTISLQIKPLQLKKRPQKPPAKPKRPVAKNQAKRLRLNLTPTP